MSEPRMSRRSLVLIGLVLAAAAASFWLYGRATPVGRVGYSLYTNKLLLTTLTMGNLLLLALAAVVLGRDLYRAFLSRRAPRGRFGRRLFLSFLGIGLVPNLLLFLATVMIIQTSVDQWFSTPVEDMVKAAPRLRDAALEEAKRYNLLLAQRVAYDIWERSSGSHMEDDIATAFRERLTDAMAIDEVEHAFLVATDGRVVATMSLRQNAPPPEEQLVRRVFETGELRGWIMDSGGNKVVRAGTVLPGNRYAVFVDSPLSHSLSTDAERIVRSGQAYQALRLQKRWVKVFFISSFTLLALLVVLGSLWVGKTLSREIVVPIQMLADGTARMAAGEPDVQVPYDAVDELGALVNSFNAMSGELTRGRRQLEDAYRKVDEARRTTEARRAELETLLENLSAGVVAVRGDGAVDWTNRSARAILEIEETGPAGSAAALFPDSCRARVEAMLSEALAGGRSNAEVTLTFPKRTKVVRLVAAHLEGEAGGVLLSFDEITTLLKAQRLAAWQEVARRMAHDIKNPLTPIQLSAQRMRRKADEKATDLERVVHDGTETIEAEVTVLKNLVDEFSRFARLPRLQPERRSLRQVIRSVVTLYESSHPAIRFHLNWDMDEEEFEFDPEQIRRALVNLLDNASNALGSTGNVWIRVRADSDPAMLQVVVEDDGPGVAPDDQPRLFQPYFSTRKKGTGLGLAIVMRILEEHGGQVMAEGRDGGGLVVRLRLPRKAAGAALDDTRAEAGAGRANA